MWGPQMAKPRMTLNLWRSRIHQRHSAGRPASPAVLRLALA